MHHPVISRVRQQTRAVPSGYFLEFGGAITRGEWVNTWRRQGARVQTADVTVETPPAPPVNEEYFEWIDLLEAVDHARGQFVMVDLGAGYGRWSVRGALAARAAGLEAHCVAVEAEPSHARWLRQHFLDNGLSLKDHEPLWGAMAPEGGFVPFGIGRASKRYSGEIEKRTDTPYPTVEERRRLRARSALCRPPRVSDERATIWVPALALTDILAPYPAVDLLDLDIQGAEVAVLSAAIRRLNARVRRVHVGTHGDAAAGVRDLFTEHQWTNVYDYAPGSTADTPYGPIQFMDGVQSWVNPEVGRPEAPLTASPADEIAKWKERAWRLKQRLRALKGGED